MFALLIVIHKLRETQMRSPNEIGLVGRLILTKELKRRLLRWLLLFKRRLLHSEQRMKKLRLKQERWQGRISSRLIIRI